MNESIGNSSNRTKVNATYATLCTVNNNFVNTANNEFLYIVNNKEFLDEIKSPSQLNEHEVKINATDINFSLNCSIKNTDRVISNTDNTTDEEVKAIWKTSYKSLKLLQPMSKIFKIKTEKISIQLISTYLNMPWKINFQIGLLFF